MKKILPFIIPILIFILWLVFLNLNKKDVWSEWVFTDSNNKSPFSLILNNLVSFKFLNKYAFQNWNQLFILNFNWVISLVVFVGTGLYIWKLNDLKKWIIHFLFTNADIRIKTIFVIVLFFSAYFLMVLTFQTWTIPRYGLPLIPLIIIFYSKYIFEFSKGKIALKILSGLLILLLIIVSIYKSLDPVSSAIWGTENIAGEQMINLRNNLSGLDGIFYNLQSLKIIKQRSDIIYKANADGSKIYSSYCNWMLPKPNLDMQIFNIFRLTKLKPECISPKK